MLEHRINNSPSRRTCHLAALALAAGLVSGAALAAGEIDPEADQILRSMSTYLGGLSALSVSADLDTEILDTTGRKLQLSSAVSVVAKRPDKLYAHRRGPVADVELLYDGKVLTVHGKGLNVYTQLGGSGTMDDAIGRLRAETGLDVPAGDLLFADPYAGLMDGVVRGDYMGTAFVNDVECHHLVFRQAHVDWQMWVQVGEKPLPMKYIITSKWVTGAPQYAVRFRDWNTEPAIAAGQFTFSAPAGAKQVDTIPVDEMGEIKLEGYQ